MGTLASRKLCNWLPWNCFDLKKENQNSYRPTWRGVLSDDMAVKPQISLKYMVTDS